jgi:hypothetical protein
LTSLKNSLKRWAGEKAQTSTSQHYPAQSSCAKSKQHIHQKLDALLKENARLTEEVQFLKQELTKEYDL